jgi:hypothetical protein
MLITDGFPETEKRNDWRPAMLRTRFLVSFMLLLALVASALIALRSYANKGQLYRSAFVYQVDVSLFKAQISPFSAIVTLLAVCLGLLWDTIDKSMRVLQPYLSMSKAPTDMRKGAGLSYQSSYWVWASTKAAINKHWLLTIVTLGTTLFQIRKFNFPYIQRYFVHLCYRS